MDKVTKLKELHDLYKSGTITAEEYENLKKEVLAKNKAVEDNIPQEKKEQITKVDNILEDENREQLHHSEKKSLSKLFILLPVVFCIVILIFFKDNIFNSLSPAGTINSDDIDISFIDIPVQNEETIHLFLSINGKNHPLETLNGKGMNTIDKDDYDSFDIPESALAAVENYWAGLQKIYYIKDLGEQVSVRSATGGEGMQSVYTYKEILKVDKLIKDEGEDVAISNYSFVKTDAEGEDLVLYFKNNTEEIVVYDAPTEIWENYTWDPLSGKSPEVGKWFKLKFDRDNHYLYSCERVSNVSNSSSAPAYEKTAENGNDFYVISVSATKEISAAKKGAQKLRNKGYKAGYLWIPDYNSLSGAAYYCIYIGPFERQNECAAEVEAYRKTDPKAYGILVSDKNQRVVVYGRDNIKIIEN